jgi:hypothetical protein
VSSTNAMRGRWALAAILALGLSAACNTQNPLLGLLGKATGQDFGSAAKVELRDDGTTRLSGSVSQSKRDVWDAGPMSVGDRVVLTARAMIGSPLDPTIALFDENGDMLGQNDDVDANAGRFDSLLDVSIRWPTSHLYVAISSSFFSSQSGSYVADLQIVRGGPPRSSAPQKIMLNFIGGPGITIPNVGTFDVVPFDAARIDPIYAGQTAQIKAGIVARVKHCYRDYHVIVQTSDDNVPLDGDDVSTLYFGQFSRTVFGISQAVDTWNADICDDGIIFTDRFHEAFRGTLTAAEVAFAIGNVAAHEGGHLLGLAHVADIIDLMDTTGAASTLLGDQYFKRSVLDRTVFGIGFQNGPKVLEATVGRAP